MELLLPKSKPILCGVLYRPPKQHNFYQVLESLCSTASNFDEYETLLLGDFNTNVSPASRKCGLVDALTLMTELYNFAII